MVPCGFMGIVALVIVGKAHEFRDPHADRGLTTETAILLMYAVGAYVVYGERIVAISVAAGMAALLQFKPELHGISARLGNNDLRAIMTFVLITCVVLPILPNRTYDLAAPLNVLNPFEIWTMVVLMVGISLGGYLAYKFPGRDAGVLFGGILGGAISSTATTVSYARRSRFSPENVQLAAVVVAIASTVVFARVMLEVSVVAPQYLLDLLPPLAIMMGASAVAAGIAWLRVRNTTESMPSQQNPTELKSAIVFALLYAGILMALATSKSYFRGQGLYVVAILSGLTDMDAITLSTARLVGRDPATGGIFPVDAWRVIVVATMANLCFKWILCILVGHGRIAWHVGLLFAAPITTGGLLLWLWR